MATISLTLNGEARDFAADPERPLLYLLRDDAGLTGTKYRCLEGVCGACTVLIDGEPVRSCVTPAAHAADREVTTVEGLASSDRLDPVQQGFLEELGFQCGFCTPGQLMSAAGLLATNPAPGDDTIREAMQGNVCRCCAYPRILRSVRRAAELAASSGELGSASAGVRTVDAWFDRPKRPWDRQGVPDREYFELLGDGLVVILTSEGAQRAGRGGAGGAAGEAGGPWSANGGAWLHVGANETVTAFTGKVDVGQDNRTALSMLVADELRMPLGTVSLVMGDTDVCPYDVGTFGSRSMPDAGSYFRVTAAAARELLIRMAARRLGADPRDLEARDCRIVRAGGESIGFAELLRGVRQIELLGGGEAEPAGADGGRVVGTPTPKVTAVDVVTGRRRYVLDLTRPGMLVGLVLRPPSFGAVLRSVDVSGAAVLRGATVVAEDGFVGVAAPDLAAARVALDAIRADWNVDPEPSEAEIVEYLRDHPVAPPAWGGAMTFDAGSTAALSGDVDAALASAAQRIERTYTAAYLAHVPLETRDALAEWDGDRLTVWTGTQRPFGVRAELTAALGVAEEDVRVIVPDTGGAFGGKHTGEVAIEAARLARAARAPVKVRWTREEEMTWAYFRPFAVIDVRAGLGADGSLSAWEFVNTNSGPNAILTPYAVPNRRIRYQPADSPLRIGSYRALAATANTFARESAMDELAQLAGVDPLAFRLRNLTDERLAAVFRAAADRAGWASRPGASGTRGEPGHGFGIAGGVEKGGRIATVAEVRVDDEGRLELLRLTAAFECGEIVNPENLRNQIEGAVVMGLGGALWEAVHFEDGRIHTQTLKEYRVPRIADVPPIEVVLVDRPDIPSAGAGETPITAVAPAIANAIFAATGRRLRSMPLTPDGHVA